ncbi:MAG: hypothetical protein JXM70_01805, partial [Pirellulales bacterium]|nr:hypothetical protein [Pirellulales bacterium]
MRIISGDRNISHFNYKSGSIAGLLGFAMLMAAFVLGCGGSPGDLDQSKDVADQKIAERTSDAREKAESSDADHLGSISCRECHENFYKLWATSHHGLAMQPYSPQLAKEKLTPQKNDIAIGKRRYRADVDADGKGRMIEQGPNGKHEYPIVHVMGGKNVYYFLTPADRGRLQTLPLAYDVNRKEWYDTTASAVRHFGDRRDEALDWRDLEYTFNTSCFNCHVSQLSKNYDSKTNSYDTHWEEPGINCETCHGSGKEHIRVCREAKEKGDDAPEDIKLTVVTQKHGFTPHQVDTSCAPCHAKMVPITSTYQPGDRYFDHFSLVGLEHPDFYPDGRDLGENYTYTTWRMSPCVKAAEKGTGPISRNGPQGAA